MKRMTVLFLCLYVFWTPLEGATGSLTGRVQDRATGEPLIGANVIIRGTVLGSAADMEGRYLIHRLEAGTYTVQVTRIGYRSQTREIDIRSGQTTTADFHLESTAILTEPLVVTASKRKQVMGDSPNTIDVITRQDIQNRSAVTLEQVLQNTAGVSIVDGQVNMRGSTGWNMAAGSRVLLMVDGHPHIVGETGAIKWDTMPIEEVEQVEIVKGAGSALYGSNAMAGMINIITRDPGPVPETRLKFSWGFYDEPRYPEWRWTDRFYPTRIREKGNYNPWDVLSLGSGQVSHSRQIGRVGIILNAGHQRSTGYHQNGSYSRWNILNKTKIRLSGDQTLTFLGSWVNSEHEEFLRWVSQDRPLELPADEAGDYMTHGKWKLQSTYQNAINPKLALTVKANIFRNHWQHYFHDNDDYTISYRIGSEAQIDYVSGRHALTMGTEAVNYRTRSAIYSSRSVWDLALYGEDEITLSRHLNLTLGARYDYHYVDGISTDHQLSPRTGLVFKPAPGSAMRLSAGYGFRAPSIAEVFADITVSGFHVVPNLDLTEAERAWNFEAGFSQILSLGSPGVSDVRFLPNPLHWLFSHLKPRMMLDVSAFLSRYRNMIDVRFNVDSRDVQFASLGEARIMGFETRLRAALMDERLIVTSGYTYLDPINLNTGKMLNYRSRHRLNTGVELHLGFIILGWDYRYSSRVEEMLYILGSGFDERVPMHVMDARIILNIRNQQFTLEARNLDNYHYTLRQKYLEPIRHFMLTWRTSF